MFIVLLLQPSYGSEIFQRKILKKKGYYINWYQQSYTVAILISMTKMRKQMLGELK